MELELAERIDNLCDYTYNFTWQSTGIRPETLIPSQKRTNYNYKDLVNELKNGRDVHITGSAGSRLCYSMGVDLTHFWGTGAPENAGKVYVEGDVSSEMGMGMVSGEIYVKGAVEEPVGNVVEVMSDDLGYRKFRSITDILCSGLGKDVLVKNNFDDREKYLLLDDGVLRGTIAARCNCDAVVTVDGDVYNGTGLLMQKGVVHVSGDAGMNTGAHLSGGTVIVEGTAGEFAGAYMKKGVLILKEAKGFVGANMKDGAIFARKNVKTAPPVEELAMAEVDVKLLMKYLDIGHVEAMGYHKYGLVKERLVRMRDGSVVVRKVGE
ncbi:MAG: formylmethanofuran dehydrogenase [Candidatus Methanoperedens sp.]|nr:formylmethanofuran dehydrogenase [Candidatus Methanoperedens sp.]MCZ7404337.1 formylmethanofuran dehydrogenase [Candidatus Methanoperedens sp.]